MNGYFTVLLLLLSSKVYSQKQDEVIAIDNNVVIYSEAKLISDTICTVQQNQVFLIAESDENKPDWVHVDISRNKLSKRIGSEELYLSGFVQKSEIILIDSLPHHNSDNLVIQFILNKADTLKPIAERKSVYGLEIPLSASYAVNTMLIKWDDNLIKQDAILFDDLYNVSAQEGLNSSSESSSFIIHKLEDVFFVKQQCADGAGFYEIIWTIRNGKIEQRLIDEI